MSPSLLAQLLANGVFLGSLYLLVALGLTLIFGVMGIADFAQGALYMLGAYASFSTTRLLHLPYFASLPLAMAGAGAVGLLAYLLVYRPLHAKGGSTTFVAALGVLLIVQNLALWAFGGEFRLLQSPFGDGKLTVHGVVVTYHQAFVMAVTGFLLLLAGVFLKATKLGKALRAMSQNPEAARIVGIREFPIAAATFLAAAALAGAAGALISPLQAFDPSVGTRIILKSFAITIFGGLGSIPGALVGALLVGLAETATAAFAGAEYTDLVAFALMVAAMFVRPQGLCRRAGPAAPPAGGVQLAGGGLGRRGGRRASPGPATWAGLVAVCAILPFLFPSVAHRNLLVLIMINTLVVLSLDLLVGYAGLLSLGHAGFWGIGAYTSALLVMREGAPFPLAALAAAVVAGSCGLFIGYPSLRLRSHYFVLVTFVTGIIITLLLTSLVGITRGPMGLPAIPFATLGPVTFNTFRSKVGYYYLVTGVVLLVLSLKHRLRASRAGTSLIAIREDEDLAEAVGIDTHAHKVLVFGLSTAIAGAAGSLYAHYTTFLSPDAFTFVSSFDFFVMTVVGGAGTFAGPLVGPALITVLRDALRAVSPVLAEVAFGVLLILTVAFFPRGLAGAWQASEAQRPPAARVGHDHA